MSPFLRSILINIKAAEALFTHTKKKWEGSAGHFETVPYIMALVRRVDGYGVDAFHVLSYREPLDKQHYTLIGNLYCAYAGHSIKPRRSPLLSLCTNNFTNDNCTHRARLVRQDNNTVPELTLDGPRAGYLDAAVGTVSNCHCCNSKTTCRNVFRKRI